MLNGAAHPIYSFARRQPKSARSLCDVSSNWVYFFYPDRADLVKRVQEIAASLGGELQLPTLSWKQCGSRRFLDGSEPGESKFSWGVLNGRWDVSGTGFCFNWTGENSGEVLVRS